MSICLAAEAARLIAESGLSWNEARRKLVNADRDLSLTQLPDDEEIATALREYFAVYRPLEHQKRLYEMRRTAREWMQILRDFEPRLILGVLSGCADLYSPIYLQVVSEDTKSLEIFLLDLRIDYEVQETERSGRKDPVEDICFVTDLIGSVPQEQVGMILRVFEEPPAIKKSGSKGPDRWQNAIEAQRFATQEDLDALLDSASF
jgi:hypothetical protein